MSVIDWIGIVLLVPFGFVVLGLVLSFIAGCIGSGKRRRQVLLDRRAAHAEAQQATDSARARTPAAVNSDAADG